VQLLSLSVLLFLLFYRIFYFWFRPSGLGPTAGVSAKNLVYVRILQKAVGSHQSAN